MLLLFKRSVKTAFKNENTGDNGKIFQITGILDLVAHELGHQKITRQQARSTVDLIRQKL